MSCVNNQVSDIQKSANYSLDDYQITIKPTNEFCLNSDLTQEKNNSLVLILTECITNPNSNQLIRRPISSIITVRFQQEPGLNSYSKISDLIKSNDVKLNNIFTLSIVLFAVGCNSLIMKDDKNIELYDDESSSDFEQA